jgi:hypothetical protein
MNYTVLRLFAQYIMHQFIYISHTTPLPNLSVVSHISEHSNNTNNGKCAKAYCPLSKTIQGHWPTRISTIASLVLDVPCFHNNGVVV